MLREIALERLGDGMTVLPRPAPVVPALLLACAGFSVLVPVACPFRAATGLDCAACGATRALESLVHLRPLDALDHNAAAVTFGAVIVAYALLAAARWTVPPRLAASALGRHPLAIVLTLVVGWAILRNVPALAWLSSAPST